MVTEKTQQCDLRAFAKLHGSRSTRFQPSLSPHSGTGKKKPARGDHRGLPAAVWNQSQLSAPPV